MSEASFSVFEQLGNATLEDLNRSSIKCAYEGDVSNIKHVYVEFTDQRGNVCRLSNHPNESLEVFIQRLERVQCNVSLFSSFLQEHLNLQHANEYDHRYYSLIKEATVKLAGKTKSVNTEKESVLEQSLDED
jgi:hypothetical protein